MPSCTLTNLSTLLTPDGWVRLDRSPRAARAVGVDRHGAFVVHPVTVQQPNALADLCFVGTRSAFGAFHQESILIDGMGVLRSVKSIVEADVLGSIRFERALGLKLLSPSEGACCQIWRELENICISRDDDEVVIRALQQTRAPKLNRPQWMTFSVSGERQYIAIRKMQFLSALQENGVSVLLDALNKMRSNVD